MKKHLPLSLIILFFLSAFAHAQNPVDTGKITPDSLAKRAAATMTKSTPTDPDMKKDSFAKAPAAGRHKVLKKDTAGLPSKNKVSLKSLGHTAELKHSPIRTLSDRKYNGYLNGEDMDDMSLVAEMNNYPLPDKALRYKVQLGLNPGQIMKLKTIDAGLHRKKLEMGENIIGNEKMLDSLFHNHQAVDGTIIFYTNRYGLYLGELRNAILQACYETEAILSNVQIKKLGALLKTN